VEKIDSKLNSHVNGREEWVTPQNISDIHLKNKLWKKIRAKTRLNKEVDLEIVTSYRKLKNKIRIDLEHNKQNFLKNKIEENKNMWDMVNKISGKRTRSLDEVVKTNFKNKSLSEIGNKFNFSFMEQVDRLKLKYKRKSNPNSYTSTIPRQKIDRPNQVKEASAEEFITILKEARNNDSTGMDGFALKHFKQSPENSAQMLKKLTNCIIKTHVWPMKLKIGVYRPIYKKGVKNNVENYRPIVILSVINKLIEKFFAMQLQHFLHKWNIVINDQFGFQTGKGTTEALISINEKISRALNEGKHIGAIFIDLQKAFDTVNRPKLISKLFNLGLNESFCKILSSYLEDRHTSVKIDHEFSDTLPSYNGVHKDQS